MSSPAACDEPDRRRRSTRERFFTKHVRGPARFLKSGGNIIFFLCLLMPVCGFHSDALGEEAAIQPLNGAAGFESVPDVEGNPYDPYIFGFSRKERNPVFIRIPLQWSDVEDESGDFRWDQIESLLNRYTEEPYEPILVFAGGHPVHTGSADSPPSISSTEQLGAWLRFIRLSVRHFRKQCRYFEIWEAPNRVLQWLDEEGISQYGFLLKKSAVEIRSVLPGAVVAAGSVRGPDLPWIDLLCAQDIGPYIDVIPYQQDPEADIPDAVETAGMLRGIFDTYDVRARIWETRVPLRDHSPNGWKRNVVRRTLVNAFAGVALTTFEMPAESGDRRNLLSLLTNHQKLFTSDLSPIPQGQEFFELRNPEGMSIAQRGTGLMPFFGSSSFRTFVVVYDDFREEPFDVDIVLGANDITGPTFHDLLKPGSRPAPFEAGTGTTDEPRSTVFAKVSSTPLILAYGRAAFEGAGAPSYEVDVLGARRMSVEEIIARHQAFQAEQDARLEHFVAEGDVSLHLNIAEVNTTFDITTETTFYYDRITGMEWEQKAYFINGVRWRAKKFPKLPLVQPEKVPVLPLEINLDKEYTYELEGENRIGDILCYQLSFRPSDSRSSRYSGRVWIDKVTFARVKISSVQTNLEEPIISNDQSDFYRPVFSDGEQFWLLDRIEGQQIFTTSGRNTAVERKIRFLRYDVNPPGFHDRREESYDSGNNILRDTEQGMRYLERNENGEMEVVEELYKKVIAGVAGVFFDPSLKQTVPLAGVDYFDFDFLGTGAQLNVFFAGLLATINLTQPQVGDTGVELGANLFGIGIPFVDSVYRQEDGGEIPGENVEEMPLQAGVYMGYNFGNFYKLRLRYECEYRWYGRADDTSEDFVVPDDTRVDRIQLSFVYQRRGYSLNMDGAYNRRARWDFWGRPEGQDYNPDHKDFLRYGVTGAKDFYLPLFQRIHFDAGYFGGSNLDRFSKYNFGSFGDTSLHGYSTGTLKADRAAVAHLSYGFNFGEIIRLEAFLDGAYYRDIDVSTEYDTLIGTGLGATFVGPWQTILNLDYGYGFNGLDNEGNEGTQVVYLAVLRLF